MSNGYRSICALAVLMLPGMIAQVLFGQDVTLPDGIRQALARNAQQLSPVAVSYTRQYRTSLPREELKNKLGISGSQAERFFAEFFFDSKSTRLIWQDGKIYSWHRSALNDGEAGETSFDGKVLYIGSPDQRWPDGTVHPVVSKLLPSRLAQQNPQDRYIGADYFDAIDLPLPTRSQDLQANKGATPQVLGLLEGGGRLAAVEDADLDGRRVTRVEVVAENPERVQGEGTDLVKREQMLRGGRNTEEFIQRALEEVRRRRELPETRNYVFYLDPEMGYAVLRREESYEDGKLLLQVNNDEFERLEGRDVWLPRKSTVDYYTTPQYTAGTLFESPIVSEVFEVSDVKLDRVGDEQFALNYSRPGTQIYDNTMEKQLAVEIPAQHEELDRAAEKAKSSSGDEEVQAGASPPAQPGTQTAALPDSVSLAQPGGTNWGWSSVILLAAIALAALVIWKYARKSASGRT